ncbi:MAG: energy transducer TonB [Acidobacteriota bacterium]
MKSKCSAIFLVPAILAALILTMPTADAQTRSVETAAVSHGAMSEIRFRPFAFVRIRDRQMLADVERIINEDPFGQLISVADEADADFLVAFVNKPASNLAKAGFVLPESNQITSDHTGQMVVYTKNSRGQIRIVWADQKGGNRPERAMFEFLRALDRDKEACARLPIRELNDQIAATEIGIEKLGDATKPKFHNLQRAKYNEAARANKVMGTVVMSVILNSDGELSDLMVIRGLPYGLTANCIEALKKLRFTPAMRDGKSISIRTYLEFNFMLY